jgi:hypothetical protein
MVHKISKALATLVAAFCVSAFAALPAPQTPSVSLLSTVALPNGAELWWSPSPSPDVTGYRVYYGEGPRTYDQPKGSGVDVGNKLKSFHAGFPLGTRIYFAVTAYNAAGEESDYSGEVSKLMGQ